MIDSACIHRTESSHRRLQKKINNYIEEKIDYINYKNYLNYFERNWIKGNIPIKTWNSYEVVNYFGKFKRTNNCVDNFHIYALKKVTIII